MSHRLMISALLLSLCPLSPQVDLHHRISVRPAGNSTEHCQPSQAQGQPSRIGTEASISLHGTKRARVGKKELEKVTVYVNPNGKTMINSKYGQKT